MMFLKTAFIAAFIPALSFASECSDDKSFTFTMDSNGFVQTCDWITRNEDKTDNRRETYCNRGEIKGACPVSCDMCPCADDLSFQFTTTFSGASVECDWLVKKNASKRKADYCPVQEIGSACVNTCGFCREGGGTPAPSGVPSVSPSAAPSGDPTQSPTSTPTISLIPTDLSTTQPSVSMGPTIAGTRSPSTSPSSNPSARPSITGTMRPSTSPSKAPTELPSKSPTMSPIVGCADDPIFTFKLDNDVEVQCDWLLKKNQETRFNNYCGRGHVKTACKNACRFCTCDDTPGFTFKLNIGNTVTCEWFSENNAIKRQYTYCFDEDNRRAASEIGSNAKWFCMIFVLCPSLTHIQILKCTSPRGNI